MTGPATFRCFVAVDLPPAAKDFLGSFVREAAREFPDYRFGFTANLHLTLQFLGDVERSLISGLTAAISSAATRRPAFRCGLGEAGSFPARGTPRILHVSLGAGAQKLTDLAGEVSQSLSELGYRPDKPFTPHITLGRVRNRDGRPYRGDSHGSSTDIASLWRDAWSRHRTNVGVIDLWVTGEVLLMESILEPKGPIYVRRGTVPLAGHQTK